MNVLTTRFAKLLVVPLVGSWLAPSARADEDYVTAELHVTAYYPPGAGGSQGDDGPELPGDPYDNTVNSLSQSVTNGGAATQGGNIITRVLADDIMPVPGSGGVQATQITFCVSNLNPASVTVRPRLRFWFNNGNAPGTYYNMSVGGGNVGYNFNPIALPPGVSCLSASFTPDTIGNLILPNGVLWAGITFDNNNGSTGATATQLNNIGMGLFNPPTDGSSTNEIFTSTSAGSFFGTNNPPGTVGPLPGPNAPVANLGLRFAGPLVPANDSCASAITLAGGSVSFNTANATTDGPPHPTGCNFAGDSQINRDIWYNFTAACSGNATASLCGSSFDTRLAVYAGCACPASVLIGCNEDTCGTQSQVVFPVTAGSCYKIRVGGSLTSAGIGTLMVTCFADCNGNGVLDATDIAAGTSADCNGNGVPDECDLSSGASQDCNADRLPDECDIAQALSVDIDNNGVPDDCQPGGEIHGTVVANVLVGSQTRTIPLPDIMMFSQSVQNGAQSPHVLSDLGGHFVIPHMLSGTYSLCWNAPGFVNGCSSSLVSLGNDTAYPELIPVSPLPGVVFGRTLLHTDRPAVFKDAAFNVDLQTHVFLLNGSGQTLASVRASDSGDFLIPAISSGSYTLRAVAENAVVNVPFASSGGSAEVNLDLPNTPPSIRVVFANVASAAPGSTVTVTAEASDPDGDPLTYQWLAPAVGAPFVSSNSPTVQWTLPPVPGCFQIYALVKDSKGGYDVRTMKLPTNTAGIAFSGTVLSIDGTAVAGAAVTVNGQLAQANSAGFFSVQVPAANRFVMSVQAIGYQSLSRVLTQPAANSPLPLIPVPPVSINPTQPVMVVEPELYGGDDVAHFANCLAGPIATPPAVPPGGVTGCLLSFDFDDDGDVDLRDYAHLQRVFRHANPGYIQFAANALQNASGQPPSGLLNVSLSRIDLSDPVGRFPGDYAAVNSVGQNVGLESFGAMEIEIRDGAGVLYNLAPGMSATVGIPVQALGAAAPPPTIPIWFYDAAQGLWFQEGMATLSGGYYVAQVTHFSVINADVEFVNPSCLQVTFNPILCIPFDLRVSIPDISPTKVFTQSIKDPLQPAVLYLLPPNTNIRLEATDVTNGKVIPGSTLVVNTGAAVTAYGNNAPTYPYSSCHSVTMNLPFSVPTDPNKFLQRAGLDTATIAAAYYKAIDPTMSKLTLATWKTANGFGVPDQTAIYFNQLDLGFGRRMNMKKGSGTDRAYYVTNYHNVEEARLDQNPIATVAMEYSQVGGSGAQFTKFYVFSAAGARVDGADLDGRGFKYVPALCIDCHGGSVNTLVGNVYPNNGNVGAKFIPFPIDSFVYSQFENPIGTFPFSAASQEPQFKELNREVLATSPTTAITDLVQGWYGGSGLPNNTQNTGFVPSGWSTNPNLYKDVVRPSCRICHTTRAAPLDWTSWTTFQSYGGSIYYDVCTQQIMPNAKCTYEQFWGSAQTYLLKNAGLTGWSSTQSCP